jgi:hypothetical protein
LRACLAAGLPFRNDIVYTNTSIRRSQASGFLEGIGVRPFLNIHNCWWLADAGGTSRCLEHHPNGWSSNPVASFRANTSLLKNSFMVPSGSSASVESIPFERLEPRFGRLAPHWEAHIGVAATFSTGCCLPRTRVNKMFRCHSLSPRLGDCPSTDTTYRVSLPWLVRNVALRPRLE